MTILWMHPSFWIVINQVLDQNPVLEVDVQDPVHQVMDQNKDQREYNSHQIVIDSHLISYTGIACVV